MTSFLLSVVSVFAGCELWMMRAETPGAFGMAARWAHVPAWVLIVSLVGFVRLYLRAGRLWLAWTVCGVRTLSLILNFVCTPNLNYREITALRQVSFLGETVVVAEGVPNPWMLIGQLSLLLLVIFVADAAITVWQRGDRRRALSVGGSIVFFVVTGTGQVILTLWGIIHAPITASLFFMALVAAMGYELSQDVLRAPDGRMRWIASSGRVKFNNAGKPVLMRGASLDITTRKQAEEAAHNLSGRLIQAQEEEQMRLARDLHDDLSQSLALLSVELEMFGQSQPAERGQISGRMQGILCTGEEIVVGSSPAFARVASGETGATRPRGGGARILQGIRVGARDSD